VRHFYGYGRHAAKWRGSIPSPTEEIAEFECGLDIIPLPGLSDLLEK
jgi:hypothetical protein